MTRATPTQHGSPKAPAMSRNTCAYPRSPQTPTQMSNGSGVRRPRRKAHDDQGHLGPAWVRPLGQRVLCIICHIGGLFLLFLLPHTCILLHYLRVFVPAFSSVNSLVCNTGLFVFHCDCCCQRRTMWSVLHAVQLLKKS